MEIKWLPAKSSKPAQIYETGLEYCLINGDNEQCCQFVYCKDFLHDAVRGFLYGKTASIYSFTYNPLKMPPILLTKTRIALSNASDKKFLDKKDSLLDFINQIEAKVKLKKTTIDICSNPSKKYTNGIIVLTGSSRWQEAPPMLSLYTLLIRIGFIHQKGKTFEETIKSLLDGKKNPYQINDKRYLTSSKKSLDRIIKDGYRKLFYKDMKRNYPSPKDVSINTFHDDFGIVGFSQGDVSRKYFKKKKKKKTNIPTECIDCELGLVK